MIHGLAQSLVILELSEELGQFLGEDPCDNERLFGRGPAGVHRVLGDQLGALLVAVGEPVAFLLAEPRLPLLDSRKPDELNVAPADRERRGPRAEVTVVVVDELGNHSVEDTETNNVSLGAVSSLLKRYVTRDTAIQREILFR